MENGEVLISKQKDIDQSGFSEKKLDQDTDLQAGQWLDLKKGSAKTPSPQGKQQIKKGKPQEARDKEEIVKELQEQSRLYEELVQEYSRYENYHSKESERVLQRIFTVQSIIKNLLQSLKRSS